MPTDRHETPRMKKLRQQQEKLKKQMALEKKRISAAERKEDTRRKIVAGAIALAHMERHEDFKEYFDRVLNRFVERPQDRALFGLGEKPAQGQEPESGQEQTGLVEKTKRLFGS